jgi:hypothetical protein
VLSLLPPSSAILLAVIEDTEDRGEETETEEVEGVRTVGSDSMIPRQGLLNVLAVLAVLLLAVFAFSDLVSFPLFLASLPFSFSFSFSVSLSLSFNENKQND